MGEQNQRHPGERDRRYLTALIEWGYQPSDVEQLILATPTADEAADVEAGAAGTGPDGDDLDTSDVAGSGADPVDHTDDCPPDEFSPPSGRDDASGDDDAQGWS